MTPWTALFLKELQGLRVVAAVLLVGVVALVAYVLSSTDGGLHPSATLLVLPYLCPPVLAGLLIHAIGQEWTAGTQHQWLALPLPRASLLLAKVAAVGAIGAGVFVVNTIGVHVVHGQLVESFGAFRVPGQLEGVDDWQPGQLWAATGAVFGATTWLLLGLAVAASGLRQVVDRFRGLLTVAVFLGGIWLTARCTPVADAAQTLLGTAGALANLLVVEAYVAAMGTLFGAVGIWLFDRHVDA